MCVVVGVVVSVFVPSPQFHSYFVIVPADVVDGLPSKGTVSEFAVADDGGQISNVVEFVNAAIGGTHGLIQDIEATQPARLVTLSEVNLKEIHPVGLVEVIENGPKFPQKVSSGVAVVDPGALA